MFITFDNMWIFCAMALVVLGFFYWVFVLPFTKLAAAGIPGPKPWPIIGNALDFVGDKESSEVEDGYIKKYGKVCGYYAGRFPVVLVADTKIARRILVKDFNKFCNRPAFESRMIYGPGRRALVHLEDDEWRRVRDIISPAFTTSKLKQMLPVMKESLNSLMTIIEENSNSGKSCNVLDIFMLYTMELMLSLSFGIKTETQKERSSPHTRSGKQFYRFDFLFLLTKIIPFYGKILHWTRLLIGPPESIKVLAGTATRAIFTRRKVETLSKRKDLLDLMLNAQVQNENGTVDQLTDEEIIGQVMMFMLAGHETTANSISLTVYNLATNPEYQEKILKEIKEKLAEDEELDYENIQKLEYLDMAYAETLRIFASVFRINRTCKESCTIDGYRFEAGFDIGIAIADIQMNPDYWPNPEKFDPERFTSKAKAEHDPLTYLPFGAGPRYCMGNRFGILEAKMALIAMLRKYKFAVAPETEIPITRRGALTLQPVNGVWVMIQKRE